MQALWMVLAAFLFASMGVCVKLASAYFNAAELVFYRGLISMAVLWALARRQGVGLATHYPGMHAWRSLIGVTSLGCWFYVLGQLPRWEKLIAEGEAQPDDAYFAERDRWAKRSLPVV